MNFKRKMIALKTIATKEIIRILRIWPQTLIPPIITTSLYFVIFGKVLFHNRTILIAGENISYLSYLIPGLIIMAIITNSYNSTASSFFISKFQKNIEEMLVSPMPAWAIVLGFAAGGMFRGLINGIMIYFIANLFETVPLYSVPIILFTAVVTAMFFSLAGLINAIFSKTFDDIAWFPAFILTPMVYLGGVFFSIEMLPHTWKIMVILNPVYHFVETFRYGFLDMGDLSITTLCTIVALNIVLFAGTVFIFNKKMQK
jgi:ABC-2 type transport system permease protein